MDTVDRIFNLVDAQYREQRDFAYDMGVTASIVSNWRCRKSGSYVKHLPQIAKLLGVSAEYLLTGNPDKKSPSPEGNGLMESYPEDLQRLIDICVDHPEIVPALLGLARQIKSGLTAPGSSPRG